MLYSTAECLQAIFTVHFTYQVIHIALKRVFKFFIPHHGIFFINFREGGRDGGRERREEEGRGGEKKGEGEERRGRDTDWLPSMCALTGEGT